MVNSDLQTTKAFHLVAGYRKSFSNDLKVSAEFYYQHLFDVPVSIYNTNTFSMVNISDGLPDIDLNNNGRAENKGVELTFDKSFSKNYYFLTTLSLFNSEYMSSSSNWYSTYYNSNFVFNFVSGREFRVGKYKQNVLGFNLRNMARGGYRFTPPDNDLSIKRKAVVYNTSRTFGAHLPFYDRMDFGVNFRLNRKSSAFTCSLDIQNVLNRHNIYARSFSYSNGAVVTRDKKLIGLVPIAGFRFDF
jgi:outer membrane receptor protein involved in Fe transport